MDYTVTQKHYYPLPTLAQFKHCHDTLWERPADFAAYEYAALVPAILTELIEPKLKVLVH